MNTPAKLKALDLDSTLAAVSKLTEEQNIPTLVHPKATDVAETKVAHRKKGPQPAANIRTSLELPDYLRKEMARKTADTRKTLRFQVLDALKANGYTVHDIDLHEDGRRG